MKADAGAVIETFSTQNILLRPCFVCFVEIFFSLLLLLPLFTGKLIDKCLHGEETSPKPFLSGYVSVVLACSRELMSRIRGHVTFRFEKITNE